MAERTPIRRFLLGRHRYWRAFDDVSFVYFKSASASVGRKAPLGISTVSLIATSPPCRTGSRFFTMRVTPVHHRRDTPLTSFVPPVFPESCFMASTIRPTAIDSERDCDADQHSLREIAQCILPCYTEPNVTNRHHRRAPADGKVDIGDEKIGF